MDPKVALEHYMLVLPSSERHTLQQSLQLRQKAGASPTAVQQEQLVQLLTRLPYPTLQILQHFREQAKFVISEVIGDALERLICEYEQSATCHWQFINMLSNLPLGVLEAATLRAKLLHTLQHTVKSAIPGSDAASMALLSRAEPTLLTEFLTAQRKQWQRCDTSVSKEFVLQQAHEHRLHFAPLLSVQLKQLAAALPDVAVRHNLLILKVVNEFSQTTQTLAEVGNIAKWLDELVVAESPPDLQEVHKFFYEDFQRTACQLAFLQQHPDTYKSMSIGTLLNAPSVLELLLQQGLNVSYEETRRLIESTYKWQPQLPLAKHLRSMELQTLNYYAALTTVYDVILADSSLSSEQYYSGKMQQLQLMLRQLRNLDVLCSLMEDIFQLVFLRWEHLQREGKRALQTQRSRSNKSSSSEESTEDAATETAVAPLLLSATRHGFVCRGRALHSLFALLKHFTTRKLHSEDYKQASDRVQLRFQRIVDVIGEALWKYAVLEKIDESLTRAGTQQQGLLRAEELLQLVQLHANPAEKSSSDEENRERYNYTSLTRRKAAKKRRRATFSDTLSSARLRAAATAQQCRAQGNLMSVSTVQDVSDPLAQRKARELIVRLADRSIIPKMLSTPENLAIMALALKNLDDVKYIIETFNLQNSELNRELSFVEQQQNVKVKLASIYVNYQQQEQRSGRGNCGDKGGSSSNSSDSQRYQPKATVEQIKQVAAKGFEVSKIINLIDNFAHAQRVQQSPELQQLLQKYSSHAQYSALLRQYEARNLNALLICDLILNLPFNHEITSHILMVIKRQQQIAAGIVAPHSKDDLAAGAAAASASQGQLPGEMGAMPLLENLCECLRLLEDRQSLQQLLGDNYYALRPRKLTTELQRERAFHAVFHKAPAELARSDELKAYAPLFQQLQAQCNYYARFCAYMTHLTQLVQLRDRNLEYPSSQLLKIDPCRIIGELIFECDMTPLEIEANVAALNLNLVHVIALNMCPQMASNGGADGAAMHQFATTAVKQQTVLNYIAHQNRLLAHLLQCIHSSPQLTVDKSMQANYLQRCLELPELQPLAALYGDNIFIAALRADNLQMQQLQQLSTKLQRLHILLLHLGNRGPQQIKENQEIDCLIVELIEEDAKHIQLAGHMQDIALRAQLIEQNFTKIATTRLAKELIEHTLHHREATRRIPGELRVQLEHTLADITVYAKVSEVLQFETWPQAYDFSLKTPNAIFQQLLQLHLYKLCYKWCKVVQLVTRFASQKGAFLDVLLDAFLELRDDEPTALGGLGVNTYLLQILETFPPEDCVSFLNTHKDKFRSVALLQYVIDFLTSNELFGTGAESAYKNYKISLRIFEQLTPGEREQFWNLLRYPLLIVEQLIMNAKFELLTKVLQAVRPALQPPENGSSQPASAPPPVCGYCHDKRGNLYDIRTKGSSRSPHKLLQYQLGAADANKSASSAFILLNFNLYRKEHLITNDCIDLLLRIYATKALDYHIADSQASWERISQSTDVQQSLDSLCGAFEMPLQVPTRDDWVRDEDATHCMCCRRAAFSMLMRRHHCRRCGRVVCFACSTHRMRLPEVYAEVEVRVCNDCQRHSEEAQTSPTRGETSAQTAAAALGRETQARGNEVTTLKWKLSGNITHDKLLREEFCYEHAPSVALSLSILGYHLGQQKCIDLLLYHCHQLEELIVPNPEVDYELVAKMMNCLALAAKVRGGPAEVETIREHSEIILSVVQYGCEALIPPGPLNNRSLRKLADSLVQAEKWQLALEVHLKCGFPTAGVMAAHGLSCLRAGCFETARDKFSYCMPKLSNEAANARIYKCLLHPYLSDVVTSQSNLQQEPDMPKIKRPQRGPPLLQEILKLIEAFPFMNPQEETLQRASVIRNSNTSLVSLLSRRKDTCVMPMQEPALNVLTTLANLKRIAKGQYGEFASTAEQAAVRGSQIFRHTRGFEECMHYVLTYGSHADILQFLMRHQDLKASLKYLLIQELKPDLYIHHIYMVCLRCGRIPALVEAMLQFDAHLHIWRQTLFQTCRYLETQQLLNSLYQLQLLLKDPVRASMTCVKFYAMNCENFQQQHANAEHLHNAQRHLQSELEIAQWENITLEEQPMRERRGSLASRRSSNVSNASSLHGSFLMQMDARSLNSHINTILRQLDVAKFLAKCEKENSPPEQLITEKVLKELRLEAGKTALPTLFDAAQERVHICTLLLLCGKNIEEGFGLAYRIIEAYKLPPMQVFSATTRYLARNQRLPEVEKLLSCITSNNGTNRRDLDELLSLAINSARNCHEPEVKSTLDNLTKRIHCIELRISCHIFIGQLKSAYLLANMHDRLNDIRRILRQAELTNQVHIKKLCEKKLNLNVAASAEQT